MWLYEYEGSELFQREGISTPNFALASNAEKARRKAEKIGLPVVIKAQVLAGGRGLAGAVQVAESLEQVEAITNRILNSTIKGLPVQQVMVAQKIDVSQELYLSVTIDGYNGTPLVTLSTEGGVFIEKTAKDRPGRLISRPIPIDTGLSLSEAQYIAHNAGFISDELEQIASILVTLYSFFRKYDCLVAEINPLARTATGNYVALDAKVEIDESSLFRHSELQLIMEDHITHPLEKKARQIGVTYVDLDGEIGIISSGAGLGMATMDVIGRRLRPANFMETGGAISADLLYQLMDLVLQKEGLRAIFINMYGGINPIAEGAKGIVRYLKEHPVSIPVVAKALGNHQEETWEILEKGGVKVVHDVSTEKGVEMLIHLLEEGA